MLTFDEASRRVHDAGLRMTRPREVLLQLVLTSSGPFSVKMLHERAEAAGLNMHLATAHRNLAEFVEVGLVDEIHVDLAPILIGGGVSLFDQLGIGPINLECIGNIQAPGVTHLGFRVLK